MAVIFPFSMRMLVGPRTPFTSTIRARRMMRSPAGGVSPGPVSGSPADCFTARKYGTGS